MIDIEKQYKVDVIREGVSLRLDNNILYIPIAFPDDPTELIQAIHLTASRKLIRKPPKKYSPMEKITFQFLEMLRVCKSDYMQAIKKFDLGEVKRIERWLYINIFLFDKPTSKQDVFEKQDWIWKYINKNEPDFRLENNEYKMSEKNFYKTLKQIDRDKENTRQEITTFKARISNDKYMLDSEKNKINLQIKKLKDEMFGMDKQTKKDLREEINILKNRIKSNKERFDNSSERIKLTARQEKLKNLIKDKQELIDKHDSKTHDTELTDIEVLYRKQIYQYFRKLEFTNHDRIERLNIPSIKELKAIQSNIVYTYKYDKFQEIENPIEIPVMDFKNTIKRFSKYLFAKRNSYQITGLKSGKLNRFALHKQFNIFKRTETTIKKHTVLTIGIDLSLDNDKIKDCIDMSYILSEYFKHNHVKTEVIGYNTNYNFMDTSHVPSDVLKKFNRINSSVNHYFFKTFDTNFIYSVPEGKGKNCINESLSFITERLLDRREARKLLILFSANHGNIEEGRMDILLSDLKLAIGEMEYYNIESLVFGLKTSYGKNLFPNYVQIESDFQENVLKEVNKLFLNRRKFWEAKE